jgi:hypothetical protein
MRPPGKYLVAREDESIADSARSNYLERKGIGRGLKGSMESDKKLGSSNAS